MALGAFNAYFRHRTRTSGVRFTHRLTRAIALSLLLFISLAAVAARPGTIKEVVYVVSDETEAPLTVVNTFQARLPAPLIRVDGTRRTQSAKPPGLYIAIGKTALHALLQRDDATPILSLLVPSATYYQELDSARDTHKGVVSAIFPDPSPKDQIKLIQLIFGRTAVISVPLSEKNGSFVPLLESLAATDRAKLHIEIVTKEETVFSAIGDAKANSVLLALPDGDLYNARTIRNALLSSYRRGLPIVGYSASMVRAGSLASVTSSIEDIAAQLGEVLEEFQVTGSIPQPEFPRYFVVKVNDSVASSLNVVVSETARKFARQPQGAK